MLNRPIGRGYKAHEVAEIRGGSVPALNRDVREGRYAPPDFYHGPIRIWTEETVRREREREIRESAEKVARRRETQLAAAERAQLARKRKIEERKQQAAATATASDAA